MDNHEHREVSTDPFSIRIATPMDKDAVSTLLETSYSHLLTTSYADHFLRLALPFMIEANPGLLSSGSYYVAEAGPGTLVGCGGWTTAKPGTGEVTEGEAHIRHFATHPEWIRRAIGTSLLARCIRDARSHGIRRLHCFSTLNGEPFYRASGFETIGPINVPMGPTITFPAVLMNREID